MNKNALFLVLFIALIALVNSSNLRSNSKTLDSTYKNILMAGETLEANQFIISSNGAYKLIMQGDGNLVLYSIAGTNGKTSDAPTWASLTFSKVNLPYYAKLQKNGNFEIFNNKGKSVWASNTWAMNPNDIYAVILQNDGNLVNYGIDQIPKWNSKRY
jgi:hypothetical protein